MTFTLEDWVLGVGGTVGLAVLLAMLLWKGGAKVFPWLAALSAFEICEMSAIFTVHMKGTYAMYFWTYWYCAIPDCLLLLCVVLNLAFVLFRPHGQWKYGSKPLFFGGAGASLLVATGLTWMSEPQSAVALFRLCMRTKIFASILTTELAVAVILTGLVLRCAWTRWTTGLAVGLMLQLPINFTTDIAHTYFGEVHFYRALDHVAIYAGVACTLCWIVAFSRRPTVTFRA